MYLEWSRVRGFSCLALHSLAVIFTALATSLPAGSQYPICKRWARWPQAPVSCFILEQVSRFHWGQCLSSLRGLWSSQGRLLMGFCHSGDAVVGTGGQLVLWSFLTPQETPSLPGSHLASTRGFFSTEWLLGTSGAGSRGVLGSLWKETSRGQVLGAAPSGSLLHAAALVDWGKRRAVCLHPACCCFHRTAPHCSPRSHWRPPSVTVSGFPSDALPASPTGPPVSC